MTDITFTEMADAYPFRFKAVKAPAAKRGGGWEEEAF